MLNLSFWLSEHGLSVRALANSLDVPLATVEDWVYRGAIPSQPNAELLNNFISATCTHYWVIEAPNGPLSEGVCQRCGEARVFSNSAEPTVWRIPRAQDRDSATKLKES